MAIPKAPNRLEDSGLPLVYPIEAQHALAAPDKSEFATAVRTAVRSLTVMQKEAVVVSSGSDVAWRLASDEGPYLAGHDFAPAPLAYLVTGLVADVLNSVERSFASAGVAPPAGVRIDSRFTMEGSLPRGTMMGGALPPEITVLVDRAAAEATTAAAIDGVLSSAAVNGLAANPLASTFSLTSHGSAVPVGRVNALDESPPTESARPGEFPAPRNGAEDDSSGAEPRVAKVWDVGQATPDAGSSLQAKQRRVLHLAGHAHRRADGLAVVEVEIKQPHGSTFRFLVGSSDGNAGNAAPDALTYLSAGIGFCFMTQIGRYAKILGRTLGDYHIIQDTRFTPGDPLADPPHAGRAGEPRTHVYLAPDDESFAAHALDMSEQTCFVHAMCRAELRPKVRTAAP